jgi:hypothetical protein
MLGTRPKNHAQLAGKWQRGLGVLNRSKLRLVMSSMRRSTCAVLLVTLLTVVAGCQQKSENSGQSSPEASSKQPVGKVEQAVANAVGAGAPLPAASSGPPADGVLDPARAEAEAPSGQPPKLSMGSNGTEPRSLLRSPGAALARAIKVEVTLQAGMDQGMPPIEIFVGLESKPKAATSKNEGEGNAAAKSLNVTAKIRDVTMTAPNVPPDVKQQLMGLKGGKVSFSMASDGTGSEFSSELPAGVKPEFRDLLETVVEALTLLTLPVPKEPVGNGAFWMVVSRFKSSGFGLVGYHMVKLGRADDKTAAYEFDSRRYAIGRLVDPAILPPGSEGVTLKEVTASAKGFVKLAVNSLLPTSIEASAILRGALDSGEGAPKQAVQSGTNYRITVMR